MGGRSSASNMGSMSGLVDNTDFNAFVRDNMSNPEFMAFGRSEGMDAVKDLWRETRINQELKDLHEISTEDAISQVRSSISSSTMDGWFRNADSGYKPELVDSILSNKGTLNAGMSIAYHNYKSTQEIQGKQPMSFNRWLNTPQTIYRGTTGKKEVASDVFSSYTPDKNIANKFAGYSGGSVSSIRVRPRDTLGSYQTTGEQELLVPKRRRRK